MTSTPPGKGAPQPLPRVAVPRVRLERRLDRLGPGGVALLVASAGAGKSVLVSQWADGRPGMRIAVLPLGPTDDDAVVMARDLVEAIRVVAPEIEPRIGDVVMTGGVALGQPFVDALLAELALLSEPLVLVLEDVHVLTNRALLDDVGELVSRLPETIRCILTTRRDPPWSVRHLRLDGRLIEMRGTDLALDADEARQLLLAVSGRDLTDREVASLLDRTDGWAAGLQLAAITLRDSPDTSAAIQSFAGSDRLIAEYLLEEVLDQQSPELRRFLLETSVLDWLSVEVCDAVTLGDSSRAMLDELEQRSLFVIPLDRSGERYRYQHLFGDLLRYQLRLEDPTAARELHLRASRFLSEHGHVEESIEHLLSAGEHRQAFAAISEHGHRLFERGESATLVRWLTAIQGLEPDSPAVVSVNLLAAQVAADQSDAAAETHRRLVRPPDLTRGERAAADALYTNLVWRGLPPEVVLSTTDSVLEVLPTLEPDDVVDFLGIGGLDSIQVMVEYEAAGARFLQGDVAQAASALEQVLTLPGIGYPIWRIYTLGSLALVRAWTGHCTEARQLSEAALKAARAVGVARHSATIHAHMASALVHLDQTQLQQAAHSLAESDLQNRRRTATVVNFDLHRSIAARLTAVTSGPEQALATLREPAASAKEPAVLANANLALNAKLLIGTGHLVEARAVLHHAHGTPGSLTGAHVDISLASGDLTEAQRTLDEWLPAPDDLRGAIDHQLRTAAVRDAQGDHAGALAVVCEALATATADGLRWPFLEVPVAVRVLRRETVRSPFADDELVGLVGQLNPRAGARQRLVEPITDRELMVLDYLPRRVTAQEIADDLFISVNTVKTHLGSIYRKLGAGDRDEAVRKAYDFGLL